MLSSLSSYFSFCGGERRLEPPPGQTQPTQARQGAASLGAPAQGRPVFLSRDSDSSQEFGASQYSVSRQDSVSSLFEEDDSPLERLQPQAQAQAANLCVQPHAPQTPRWATPRPDTPPPPAGPRQQAVHIAEPQKPVAQAWSSAPEPQLMQVEAPRPVSSSNRVEKCVHRVDKCCESCEKCCEALCVVLLTVICCG